MPGPEPYASEVLNYSPKLLKKYYTFKKFSIAPKISDGPSL